ncbi:MAG: phosphopyruvate hydratase [Candidatus Methanofastidiosia archaeon]
MRIVKIRARMILDSRGNPTVEVDCFTKKGFGRAQVPSGASTGEREALELRDGGNAFGGLGVLRAMRNVNHELSKIVCGMNVFNQREIDLAMIEADSTENKSRLGANAILGVSLAVARCAAKSLGLPLYRYLNEKSYLLPVPMMNVINGGAHAANDLEFQEFMILPLKKSFRESLRVGVETYHELGEIISEKYGKASTNLGDEGGYAPQMRDEREALDTISKAVESLGYEDVIRFALDVAPSHFYDEKKGVYKLKDKDFSREELIELYENLIETYRIVSIEDPMFERDFLGFKAITETLGDKIQIVGDDVFVSNPNIFKEGIENKICNALLLKVNQIGTLTEALDAAELAFENDYKVVVSHRSGETEDSFIADLSVALSCGQIKAGAPARGERCAKYNQLLRIEEELEGGRYPFELY